MPDLQPCKFTQLQSPTREYLHDPGFLFFAIVFKEASTRGRDRCYFEVLWLFGIKVSIRSNIDRPEELLQYEHKHTASKSYRRPFTGPRPEIEVMRRRASLISSS